MGFFHRKMVLFSAYFGVFLSFLLRALFWVFPRIFMRYLSPQEAINSNFSEPKSAETEFNSESFDFDDPQKLESEPQIECSEIADDDTTDNAIHEEEDDTPKLVFKFQYQTWKCDEESNERINESFDFVNNPETATTSKYEFVSGKSLTLSLFLEEPEVSILTVKELFAHSNHGSSEKNEAINDSKFLIEREDEEEQNATEQPESSCGKRDENENFNNSRGNESNINIDSEFNLDVGYEPDDFDDEDDDIDIMEELRKLQEQESQNKVNSNSNSKVEEFGEKGKGEFGDCSLEESAKPNLQNSSSSDLDDSNRFDTLWEHQDLIEQLKMELKKVRATGLPTILEDSESPRIMEDLKPWKIDDKFQNGTSTSTITNELPKFYRSYRERMRKFDILNYQKLYAIGLLQSKDPLEWFSSHKESLVSHGFGLCRRRKSESDPTEKFIREVYCELEVVYVGQLCLSWEFLQWEYEKALEIWESDPYGTRRYNEVAGEFQQFQVLLQRFIENEPFHGPRVENYVKNRRDMRNLLQVPVIREDNAKDKNKSRKGDSDKYGITSEMLVEILEESIRTIWRFIRNDKDASNLTHTLKAKSDLKQSLHHLQLQNPADSDLLVELRTDLQKKEKRVREVLRSGSCILKKFQKQKDEEGTDQVLYFFSQVDMKLVWRVLNMRRITTDQLAWCRNKLNKINFVNRRLHVDPTFLLFPC